jgi:hypothetical protein
METSGNSGASTLARHLRLHPVSKTSAVESITVHISHIPGGALRLTYTLRGNLAALRIPDPQAAQRTDGLWRHTCFEAFVRAAHADAYREFNFSPSGSWQAYTFNAYRQGGLPQPATDPHIISRREPGAFSLQATLAADNLPCATKLLCGLSAVVEDHAGSVEYWALHHPPGQADFHHPDTFVLDLNPPCIHPSNSD